MNKNRPTYDELVKKLAEAEELLARLRKNETDAARGEQQFLAMYQDITEQKRAKEALTLQRDFNQSMFDTAQVIILVLEPDGRISTFNPYMEEISGYKLEEVKGKYWFDVFIPKRNRENTRDLFKNAIDNIQTRGNVDVIVTKDGRERAIEWYDKTLKNIRGKVVGLLAVGQDVTERQWEENALIESNERYRSTLDNMIEGCQIIGRGYRYLYLNDSAIKQGRQNKENLLGHTMMEVYPGIENTEMFYFLRQCLEKGIPHRMENEFSFPDGSTGWSELGMQPVPEGVFILSLDITERKQAEARVNRLNLTLRSIRNVNQLLTREKDRDRLIQKVCDSLVEGRSFESAWIVLLDESHKPTVWAATNTSSDFVALIDSFGQENIPHCVQKAFKQKKAVVTEDPNTMCTGCPIRGGTDQIGSMTIRLGIEGNIYGVMCVSMPRNLLSDKDEIALFEEVATDIAFALRDMELGTKNEFLEKERLRTAKLESVGTLAGGIAHDFNNLLAGIIGNIGLAKMSVKPSDAAYEMLDEAEKAGMRARDLTRQLLTFAKGGKPVKTLVNIAKLIEESAVFAMRGSNVKLELSLPDDLWSVEADEGQISQVINNLVINADEAMPSGGILRIKAGNLAMKGAGSLPLPSGNYVYIDVKDTGTGMTQEHLDRIFEPYFTTKQRGSGLGLTTAYSIIKNHGGYIFAESRLNKGSTFHIYLPPSKKTAKGGKKVATVNSGQAGGKVLVMDDEEIIRKMLKNMLSTAGYQVELSDEGNEALEKYTQAMRAQDPFDAVIMDLTIPGGIGGKEAIKKLLEIDPQATVIVSSGYATDPIMSEYKEYGFKEVIAKPYSVQQLRETLSGLLTKRK